MKARTLAATGMALGAGAWVAYSLRVMNRTVPGREEAEAYARSLLERVGMGELYGTWEDESLSLGDRELRLYHFRSDPEDPVVVFVPGTSVYALLYTEFLYKLSRRGFNVVGFDPRGHGMSSGRRGVYTLGELVEDTRAVIDYAARRYNPRVAVAGSSQGGITAFYCAAAEPRLRAAVCHNLIAPDEPDNYRMTRNPSLFRPLMPLLPLFKPLMECPLGKLMVPVALYLDLAAEPTRLVPDVAEFLRQDPLAVTTVSLGALYSLPTTPLARRVEEITMPVMVIHSGKDNIFPEDYVRRVYDRLRCKKKFLYLPDAPHLVMTDYVEEIVPPLAEWLREVMGRQDAKDAGSGGTDDEGRS
ncbi:MAG: alpha/beta fold hydrolase [Actinobacteria bacterium]|nr:alpha/beta fold hydrolase [Actinomycetota bacterium]